MNYQDTEFWTGPKPPDLLLSDDKIYDYISSYKKLGYECLILSINNRLGI
ncbi:hypothetical protein [Spiroplasma endosymbiont of Agriotes lineatus]